MLKEKEKMKFEEDNYELGEYSNNLYDGLYIYYDGKNNFN